MEEKKEIHCRICGAEGLSFVRFLHGEYFHQDVPLYKCRRCLSYLSRPSRFQDADEISDVFVLDWHLMAENYNRRKAQAIFRTIDRKKWLPPSERKFLDIGCGIGHSVLEAERWGYTARGLEPEKAAVEYAREKLNANVDMAYFEGSTFAERSYDLIMLDNVLEHLPTPRQMFRDILNVLRDDGIFFLGVPPVEWIRRWLSISYMSPRKTPTFDWRSWASRHLLTRKLARLDTFGYPDGHINYFSRKSIDMLCAENNCRVVELFHLRNLRLKLFPLFGLTTGFYFIRKLNAVSV